MSTNLKYFYIISFALVVVAVILSMVYGRVYVERYIIRTTAERSNRAAVEKFVEVVWAKHRKTLDYLPCDRTAQGRCPDITRLAEDYYQFFATLPMLSYELYDNTTGSKLLTDGRFADDPNYNERSKNAFSSAQRGTISSDLFFGYKHAGTSYNVVKTYFPILVPVSPEDPGQTKIPAVLELVYNITPFWDNPMQVQIVIISTAVVLFALLFGIMYYLTYKA